VQLAPPRRPALTIELISPSGERMRIESAEGLDLADVVYGFWSRRA
jgi:subtilisin-like proprotein convertase family protein